MHLYVNLRLLEKHQEYIAQEAAEAEKIKTLLEKLHQLSLNDVTADQTIYLNQLVLIDQVLKLIYQRQAVLDETFKILSDAKRETDQRISEAQFILRRTE